MDGNRVQFRVDRDLKEDIEHRETAHTNANEIVRQMARRYVRMTFLGRPSLLDEEKEILAYVYYFSNLGWDSVGELEYLWAEVEDTDEEQFEALGVKKEELVEKVKGWSFMETVAVADYLHIRLSDRGGMITPPDSPVEIAERLDSYSEDEHWTPPEDENEN